jgi:hypothetical protein
MKNRQAAVPTLLSEEKERFEKEIYRREFSLRGLAHGSLVALMSLVNVSRFAHRDKSPLREKL